MAEWTLDELVRRAAEALAAQDVRVPNGRVTPLPDRRVVRWYATIGLVDRPLAYRGRTALYGRRHLLQVVAVKRRQAEGRSLAEIQAELAGATDRTLRELAQIDLDDISDAQPPSRPRFWAEPPPPPASTEPDLRYGVPLHPSVTLMLHGQPDADDLTEIRAAARPLLDLLARRGLLTEGG
jgi:DNA-binding transcriptional MerR regulator